MTARLLRLPATYAAGIFAGSLTNTPALASVLEYFQGVASPAIEQLLMEPVVAYSVKYPAGVVDTLAALALARCWRQSCGRVGRL